MTQQHNSTPGVNFKTESLDDEVTLTFFKGPSNNTTPDKSDPMDWDELSQRFSQPERGPKDGSYFVRTKCNGLRSDKNMNPLSPIIIIDADSGPNSNPCPPPDYVADCLNEIGYQYIIYTSHSHTPEKPKYRIILLLDRDVTQAESKRLYKGIIDHLSDNGIGVENNSESSTWSQPWFLPRYETEEQRNNFFHADGGFKRLPVDEFVAMDLEPEKIPRNELSQDQILKLKKETPPCIEYWGDQTELETTDHRNFNLIKMSLVAYYLSIELSEDQAVSRCREFIDNYPFSNSLKTPEARLSNLKQCYRSMKQSGCTFSCATIKTLCAPKDAYDCKKCPVEKPNTVEEVSEWMGNIRDPKDILTGWIEKTRGMDAVSTDTIIKAVSQKTGVGLRPLKEDLKNQKKTWRLEKQNKSDAEKSIKLALAGIKDVEYKKTATGDVVMQLAERLRDLDTVYRYGNLLVSVVESRPESVKTVQQVHGNGGVYPLKKVIHVHTVETCRHELEKVVRCIEYTEKGVKKEILIPTLIVQGLLDTPNSKDKPLTGLVEHPYVDSGYNPVVKQGYDPNTGLFKSFPDDLSFSFQNTPSISEAKAAFQYLRDEVMVDFPFASDLDMVGGISIMVTALQRKMITGDSGCPGYQIDAPARSTGKTALIQMVSYSIYNGPVAASSWSNNDEEIGKHILGILREGHSCVLFDNLPQGTSLESNELAKAMTNPIYSKRLLRENKTMTVPSQVLWIFTGNNISIAGDFNTRMLQIRLDANMADPDRRKFKRPDLGAWCQQNRAKIIHACMTIILANKGSKTDIAPTRFGEWDKFVRMPLFEATGIDIADLFERNKSTNAKTEGLGILLESWYEEFGEQPVTSKEVLKHISVEGDTNLEDALRDIFGGKLPTTRELGSWLSALKGRIIGEYRVSSTIGTSKEQLNISCWKVTNGHADV